MSKFGGSGVSAGDKGQPIVDHEANPKDHSQGTHTETVVHNEQAPDDARLTENPNLRNPSAPNAGNQGKKK